MVDLQKPANFQKVILLLAEKLKNRQYAFRGTASLVLQGIEMNVADIDILCDKETALDCNDLLAEYLVEEVSFKESGKFKSYFGKFEVEEILVEVMGEWQIKNSKGEWSQPFNASGKNLIKLDGTEIPVTTIEEELSVFAKMGRWTAFQKIKKQIGKPGENQPRLL